MKDPKFNGYKVLSSAVSLRYSNYYQIKGNQKVELQKSHSQEGIWSYTAL